MYFDIWTSTRPLVPESPFCLRHTGMMSKSRPDPQEKFTHVQSVEIKHTATNGGEDRSVDIQR